MGSDRHRTVGRRRASLSIIARFLTPRGWLDWRVIVGLNLLAGLVLWLTECTDLAVAGTIPNMLFAPAGALFGIVTLVRTRRRIGQPNRLVRLTSLPLVIGGVPHLLIGGFLVGMQAVLVLPLLFGISELANEAVIQRTDSPDGTRSAEVHFWAVGAYAPGNGRVAVRVKQTLVPLLEREVYYLSVSRRAAPGVTDYVTWLDNETLYVAEKQATIPIGPISTRIPLIAVLPLALFQQWQATTATVTAPVSQVPLYPGQLSSDRSARDGAHGTVYRSFTIGAPDPDEQRGSENLTTNPDRVFEWYGVALSESPWSVVRTRREPAVLSGRGPVTFCIQAERREEDGQSRTYYVWGRARDNIIFAQVDMNITTPSPLNDLCRDSADGAR